MSVVRYDQRGIRTLEINNQTAPTEGPRCLPLSFDFSVGDTYLVDLLNLEQQTRVSMIQTIYIDASSTDSQVVFTALGSQQVVTAKGRTQGFYNVLVSNPSQVTFQCDDGSAVIPVQLINTPIAGAVWATQ